MEIELFNIVKLKSLDELDDLTNSIDKQKGLFFIEQALKTAQQNGLFSIQESEIISKSLREIGK